MGPATALAVAAPVGAQSSIASPALVLIALAAMSVVPFAVLLMSSFVKIVIVLSVLKSALGAPQIPPSQIITGIALVLTVFVMAPTGERMFKAVEPELSSSVGGDLLSAASLMSLARTVDKAKEPLREFLLKHGSPKERTTFLGLARRLRSDAERAEVSERDFLVVASAFMASELRRAFEIGFLIFLPFMVIDLVISSLLLALGMSALSPTTVSLPFKLLLFVLADGWQLLMRGLVASYG